MKEVLNRIDKKIYSFERFCVGHLFLAMSGVVFVDVLHRVFSRSPGRLAVILGDCLGMTTETFDLYVSPVIIFLAVFTAAFFAVKGNHKARKTPISKGRNLFYALMFTTISSLAVRVFLTLDPEGIVWAPYFGLICLLWIGFMGASMATHTNQHLLLEMGEKIWPQKFLPTIRMIAHIVVAIFVITISYLGILSVSEHYNDFSSGPGAGLVPSIDWPKWIVYLVIPYAFGMMGLRFIGIGLGIFKPVKTSEF